MKTIVIRVDSSWQMGMGHLQRCLNFAEVLREQQWQVIFMTRELPGNSIDLITQKNFLCYKLITKKGVQSTDWQADAEEVRHLLSQLSPITWLIVDHYALDRRWQNMLRSMTQYILVIDDIADRPHDCELLLDQNYYHNQTERYQQLVPHPCMQLLGPRYALLKQEWHTYSVKLKSYPREIKRILISFGGSDATHQTKKVVDACLAIYPHMILDVVVGAANQQREQLQALAEQYDNIHYYCQLDSLAPLMMQADLSIGAAGITTWERCCVGLPSMVITVAVNQEQSARDLATLGVIEYLGSAQCVTELQIQQCLQALQATPKKLQQMQEQGKKLVDGKGCYKVMEKLCEYL